MRPEEGDMARLWDMLDAARAAVQFTQGRRFDEMLNDRMLRCAVERCLEIVGEAARYVTPRTRALSRYPMVVHRRPAQRHRA